MEAEDGGLLLLHQFVDVVVLRAVAMMCVLPVGFEFAFQNCLGLVVLVLSAVSAPVLSVISINIVCPVCISVECHVCI